MASQIEKLQPESEQIMKTIADIIIGMMLRYPEAGELKFEILEGLTYFFGSFPTILGADNLELSAGF